MSRWWLCVFLLTSSLAALEPRVELRVVDVSDKKGQEILARYSDHHPQHVTLMRFRHFPVGEKVKVVYSRDFVELGDKVREVSRYEIGDNDMLVNEVGQLQVCHATGCVGYVPGERVHYRVLGEDNEPIAHGDFYPHPIMARTGEGAVIYAHLLGVDPTQYNIIIPNRVGHPHVLIRSTSGGEFQEVKIPLKKGKETQFWYSPDVIGMEGGIARVEVICDRDGRVYSLDLPWGNVLEDYLYGHRITRIK